MKTGNRCRSFYVPLSALLLCGFLANSQPIYAQQEGDNGYRTREDSPPLDPQAFTGIADPNKSNEDKGDLTSEGPVRMARFAYVSGNVTWRPEPSGDWTQATVNMPMRQGAEILVLKGGRADIQFDDGSSLRLGNGALVSLKTLYSDSKGEYTQITLKDGLATLRSRHAEAVFEVDTPMASVRTTGASQVRFGVDGGSEIAMQMGSGVVEGPLGKTTLMEGNYLYLKDKDSPLTPKPNPVADSWDDWNKDRDRYVVGESETYKHVPPNQGLVAEDLDQYGTWHDDSKYGWVWTPSNVGADWRPYSQGRWVWEEPFGWTWVSSEPWGWAPYHYGTWCQLSWGWSWCPGPRSQYWSPGVVSFGAYGGDIGWAPLCPWEVVYPSYCGLGIWGADWCLDFSIGWCGCYFPFRDHFCEGRRFDNHFVNGFRSGFDSHFGSIGRFNNSLEGVGNRGFVPFNARNGGTVASEAAFGGHGTFHAMGHNTSVFGNGHTVTGGGQGTPVSGPGSVSPTASSRNVTRSFTDIRPSSVAAGRSTFTSPESAARTSIGSARTGSFNRTFGSAGAGSPAEAARAARASLGSITNSSGIGRSSSYGGFSRGGSTGGTADIQRSSGYGSYGSRSYGGSSSSGRTFSGGTRSFGSGSGSYRVGPSYRGSGFSRGSSGGFSGGSRSGGSFSSGSHAGGGGGRSR